MLIVNERSWHFRLYSHWKREFARKPPVTINLCHYMRALMLYLPGMYLLIGLVYFFGGLLVLITLPIWGPIWLVSRNTDWFGRLDRWLKRHEEGLVKTIVVLIALIGATVLVAAFVDLTMQAWWKGLLVFGCIIGGLLLALAIVIGLAELHDRHKERQRAVPEARRGAPVIEEPKAPRPPGFFSLMWGWVKSKKRKICPIIEAQS